MESIIVINAGSSSIKFAVFEKNTEKSRPIYMGQVETIPDKPHMMIWNDEHQLLNEYYINAHKYDEIVDEFVSKLTSLLNHIEIYAIGHRVVHGGTKYTNSVLITSEVVAELKALIPLAPLHQPYHIELITSFQKHFATIPQVACFDTAFHVTQLTKAKHFALPAAFYEDGIIRYGFHGLSYQYIASVLPEKLPEQAEKRVVVAHLGNGASACALYQRKSKATSMGFTALAGCMMGTRCGTMDPGVIFYLLQERKLTLSQITDLLYKKSGLLGYSGISNDMRKLSGNPDPKAAQAIELFCYRAAQEIAGLGVALNGIDALVFTAGIGEHSAEVRAKICQELAWLGISIDADANKINAAVISTKDSPITVAIIPTNEEFWIVQEVQSCLA